MHQTGSNCKTTKKRLLHQMNEKRFTTKEYSYTPYTSIPSQNPAERCKRRLRTKMYWCIVFEANVFFSFSFLSLDDYYFDGSKLFIAMVKWNVNVNATDKIDSVYFSLFCVCVCVAITSNKNVLNCCLYREKKKSTTAC